MRLIDANSIRYRNAKLEFPDGHKTHGYFAVVTSVEIEEAPTIEAEPVRHGEWKKRLNESTCSECKFIYYSNKDEWNYCPNCGAKMDGGAE